MNILRKIILGAAFLAANGCSNIDFICIEVRDASTRETPAKMSYAYLFDEWDTDLETPWPHRVTSGGSGPFYNKAALLMPVPGSPVRVHIWVGAEDAVEFKFLAPSTPYVPTEWYLGVPPKLELRAFRVPSEREDVKELCPYFPKHVTLEK